MPLKDSSLDLLPWLFLLLSFHFHNWFGDSLSNFISPVIFLPPVKRWKSPAFCCCASSLTPLFGTTLVIWQPLFPGLVCRGLCTIASLLGAVVRHNIQTIWMENFSWEFLTVNSAVQWKDIGGKKRRRRGIRLKTFKNVTFTMRRKLTWKDVWKHQRFLVYLFRAMERIDSRNWLSLLIVGLVVVQLMISRFSPNKSIFNTYDERHLYSVEYMTAIT